MRRKDTCEIVANAGNVPEFFISLEMVGQTSELWCTMEPNFYFKNTRIDFSVDLNNEHCVVKKDGHFRFAEVWWKMFVFLPVKCRVVRLSHFSEKLD